MPVRKRRAAGDGGGGGKRVNLGNPELTRLWNCGSTELDELTSVSLPTLSDFLEPAREELREKEAMTDGERKNMEADPFYLPYKKDLTFMWRALRLMAKTDVRLFQKAAEGTDLDEIIKELDRSAATETKVAS
eukprot:SAG31_NODE_7839_length_1585_cov_1.447510_1_plen_133_part_00